MTHTIRSNNHRYMVALAVLALLLALFAWPAAASAQQVVPDPDANEPGNDPSGIGQPANPVIVPPGPDDTTAPVVIPAPQIPDNRVVKHAATPAQLIKAGEGLHYYYIGADGSATTGPYIVSFAKLAEMYPTGGAVSLFSGANPLTGKSVNIYYLADQKKIQVNTFYPASHDQYNPHKAYNFTVDSSYAVNHLAW
ncbi:MAG: hypothetical protein OXO48_00885 [Caldilineaceae bacterium]|nr:hypothetical protein [Caldilineaceae bacterium]MDE0431206.1 hypothetical protein [Caldilineaceae bacterium]